MKPESRLDFAALAAFVIINLGLAVLAYSFGGVDFGVYYGSERVVRHAPIRHLWPHRLLSAAGSILLFGIIARFFPGSQAGFPFIFMIYIFFANLTLSLFMETEVFVWALIAALMIFSAQKRNEIYKVLRGKNE